MQPSKIQCNSKCNPARSSATPNATQQTSTATPNVTPSKIQCNYKCYPQQAAPKTHMELTNQHPKKKTTPKAKMTPSQAESKIKENPKGNKQYPRKKITIRAKMTLRGKMAKLVLVSSIQERRQPHNQNLGGNGQIPQSTANPLHHPDPMQGKENECKMAKNAIHR